MVFGTRCRAPSSAAPRSRTLPSGPGRAAPLLSIASSWREVRGSGAPTVRSRAPAAAARLPRGRARTARRAALLSAAASRRRRRRPRPRRRGLGGAAVHHDPRRRAGRRRCPAAAHRVPRTLGASHRARGRARRDADAHSRRRTAALTARDARRRAATVERVVAHAEAMPAVQRDRASGQLVSPPRISAAVDPERGVYHAFAIYELRTAAGGGVEGPWHVFVSDVFNMRQLLPQQDSWLPNVASLLLSVLRRKSAGQSSSPSRPSRTTPAHIVLRGDWLHQRVLRLRRRRPRGELPLGRASPRVDKTHVLRHA